MGIGGTTLAWLLGGTTVLMVAVIHFSLRARSAAEAREAGKSPGELWLNPGLRDLDPEDYDIYRLIPHANWVRVAFDIRDQNDRKLGEISLSNVFFQPSQIAFGHRQLQAFRHTPAHPAGSGFSRAIVYKEGQNIVGDSQWRGFAPGALGDLRFMLGSQALRLRRLPRWGTTLTEVRDADDRLLARTFKTSIGEVRLLVMRPDAPEILVPIVAHRAMV